MRPARRSLRARHPASSRDHRARRREPRRPTEATRRSPARPRRRHCASRVGSTPSERGGRPGGEKRHRQRRLGHAVDRRERAADRSPSGAKRAANSSSTPTETGSAPLSAKRQLDRVEPLELRVLDALETQRIREARRGRDGRTMARDRAQPERRARQKQLGRNQHQRIGPIDAAQQAADEPHVVMQRQPRDADLPLRAARRHHLVDGVELRHQVRLRERYRLGIDGRPRRELDERHRAPARCRSVQLGGPDERIDDQAAELGRGCGHGHAEEALDARVGQDQPRARRLRSCARSPRGYSSSRPEAQRRRERHRDRAGQRRAEECVEERRTRRQHQRDAIAGPHAERGQRRSDAPGARAHLAPGERLLALLQIDEGDADRRLGSATVSASLIEARQGVAGRRRPSLRSLPRARRR